MPRTLDPQLDALLQQVLRMGGLAEAILEKALRALESADLALAESVRTDDLAIDQVDVDIDSAVLHLLALQAPVAEDLRRVTASKTIAIYLERVGDLSRNLAGCAGRLARSQAVPAPARILELGGLNLAGVRQGGGRRSERVRHLPGRAAARRDGHVARVLPHVPRGVRRALARRRAEARAGATEYLLHRLVVSPKP